MTLEERTAERRKRIVAHVASSFEDAERWDLEYWQSRTPEERLSALVAIRHMVDAVEAGKCAAAREEQEDARGVRLVRDQQRQTE